MTSIVQTARQVRGSPEVHDLGPVYLRQLLSRLCRTNQSLPCCCCNGSGWHFEGCLICEEGYLFECLTCGGSGVEDHPSDEFQAERDEMGERDAVRISNSGLSVDDSDPGLSRANKPTTSDRTSEALPSLHLSA
jgi:hypothetical protein